MKPFLAKFFRIILFSVRIIIVLIDRSISWGLLAIGAIFAQLFIKKGAQGVSRYRKKLFLASGKPFRFPDEQKGDSLARRRWNQAFRSQLLHLEIDRAFAIYLSDDSSVYRLCPGVVCISIRKIDLNIFKRVSDTLNTVKIIFACCHIRRKSGLCAIETFIPGDRLAISAYLSKVLEIPLIGQCMGDYDLSSHRDGVNEKSNLQLLRWIADKFLYAVFLRQASLVLGYSDHCASVMICNGAHPKKVRRLRIQAFITEFQRLDPINDEVLNGLQGAKIVFLWCRLAPEKKLKFVFDAVEKVMMQREDVYFLIAGSGPMEKELKQMMGQFEARALFLGNLDRAAVKTHIERADVNLVPLGGYSLVEAGLCSKPVVSFNWEWHTEVLSHMESGYLVDYPDSEKYAEGINFLLDNPSKARDMGLKFNKRILQLFDDQKHLAREREIMQEFHGMSNSRNLV